MINRTADKCIPRKGAYRSFFNIMVNEVAHDPIPIPVGRRKAVEYVEVDRRFGRLGPYPVAIIIPELFNIQFPT